MRFGHSFIRQRHFGGLKMQVFENGFQVQGWDLRLTRSRVVRFG